MAEAPQNLMRISNPSDRLLFQEKIFSWWRSHKRDLPWRHTHDPYKILVSEVMLQQTQVLRVITKYREFIERYPTVGDLAAASPAAVIRIWKGLGYNRRALFLHKAAKIIVEKYGSQLPISEQQLSKLPGLGIYTARAILVFAYKQDVPLIDTNIRRIITHFFFNDQPQKPSVIEDAALRLLPKGKSWEWHQALMDYGSEESSKFKVQSSKLKKKATPFRQSHRFYRGRIIDLLRQQEMQETSFLRRLMKEYQKPKEFFQKLIEDLVAEGFIVRSKTGIVSLPDN